MIYWDHNATTPLSDAARKAMAELRAEVGNPSSVHLGGQRMRRRLEGAREVVAEMLGARRHRVVWTSGGSEADNLAVLGLARARRQAVGATRVLLGAVEHPAVLSCEPRLAAEGFEVEVLDVGADGRLDLGAADERLGADVALVALMLANNETGVLQPVAELARAAARHGVPLHCDAVQAVGKVAIDFDGLGVATLALSGHKLGAPRGIGALLLRRGVGVEPLWHGGAQEEGLRPGSEPVLLAVGLAAALGAAEAAVADHDALLGQRERLAQQLGELEGVVVLGEGAPRLPNTVALTVRGALGASLVERLDAAGLAASTGAACHAASGGEARTGLLAMGLAADAVASVLRLSFGPQVDAAEIDAGATLVREAILAERREVA